MICLFVKQGDVKTRLARDIGEETATAIYRRMVEHQVSEIPHDWDVAVYYTGAESAIIEWLEPLRKMRYIAQVEGDLGERFQAAIRKENSDRVYIAVSDCPGLTRDYLREANDALNAYDSVISPSFDGGWNLLGLKVDMDFHGIRWSTGDVLKQTICAIPGSVRLLRPLVDVDDLASLRSQKIPWLKSDF